MSKLIESGDVIKMPVRAEEGNDGRGGMGVLAAVILMGVAVVLGITILNSTQ